MSFSVVNIIKNCYHSWPFNGSKIKLGFNYLLSVIIYFTNIFFKKNGRNKDIYYVVSIELVSKELNHFGGITSFFQDWAPRTLTGGT